MVFDYDGTGIEPAGAGRHAPEGDYILRVKDARETRSKGGKPMVVVDAVIIDGPYQDLEVRYHNVTFLPKGADGAGIALAFLKAIGEPYKDKFVVNVDKWPGKVFKAHLVVEDFYSEKHKRTFKNNKIAYVEPYDGAMNKDMEEVPF